MCTVTLVPRREGLRLLTNRDESRRRRPATPPGVRDAPDASRRAILPTDADAGGTWVAVNTAGLVMTLLNANPPGVEPTRRPRGPRSRGEIITDRLGCESVDALESVLAELDAKAYGPFRLVAADAGRTLVAAGDGDTLTLETTPLGDRPRMWTSSGLGDPLVEPPRRELFDASFGKNPEQWPDEQDAFHRHHWEDRPELSVCMARADARTVSLTAVEVSAGAVRMTYHAGPPCESAEDFVLELPR